MFQQRGIRAIKVLFVLAVATVGLVALHTWLIPPVQAVCLSAYICTPASPAVTCSNGLTYPNICEANEACQYHCCEGNAPPHPRFGCPV